MGVDAFANVNPLGALTQVPAAGLWQIAATVTFIELFRINRVIKGDKAAGDLGLGQGEGRWNPFGFKYTEEEYFEKQTQEIKNGRLAMVAWLGESTKRREDARKRQCRTRLRVTHMLFYLFPCFRSLPPSSSHWPRYCPTTRWIFRHPRSCLQGWILLP